MSKIKRSLYIILFGLTIAFFAIFLLFPEKAKTLNNSENQIDNSASIHSSVDSEIFVGPKLPEPAEMRTRAPKTPTKKAPAKTDEDPAKKFPISASAENAQLNPWPEVKKFTPDQIKVMIKESAAKIGFSPDIALRIANCESHYNHMVISKSGKYWGVYQYDLKTWLNTAAGKAGKSRLDAESMINTAILHMKTSGTGAWPNC